MHGAARDRGTARAAVLRRRSDAEQRLHRRIVASLTLGRYEVEREAPSSCAGVDVELDTVRLAQRKSAAIGEQADVVIVLADGRERDAARVPRQIDLAERHVAGCGE